MTTWEKLKPGARAGLPLAGAGFLLSFSFGVLAEPLMGSIAPSVFSLVVFAGSAQFASLAILAGGGSALAAIVAGILLNLRFLPMGVALAPSLKDPPAVRGAIGQAIVDGSWALANRGEGRFDKWTLLGATLPQFVTWQLGTLLGVIGADVVGDPLVFGLDAIFPAFFLALLASELTTGRGRLAAAGGVLIAVALAPWAPPGIPIIAACVAALPGLWWRRS